MAEESSGVDGATSGGSAPTEQRIEAPGRRGAGGLGPGDGERESSSPGPSGPDPGGTAEEEELAFPGFVPVAFKCLTQTSQPRYWCLKLITWPWFERISMAVILLNCVTLGMYQPCTDTVCDSTRCRVLEGFDHFIFGFFAIEMFIKICGMGLIGKETYLAETWNRLDMFIVLAGAVEYAIDTENLSLSAIRTIRVLRPLRAINRIPSMRILVMLLLDTLPMLSNVLLLCFFVFFIFGIVGVQLWAGLLRNRCFLDLPENVSAPMELHPYYVQPNEKDYICSQLDDDGMSKCNELPHYRYFGNRCNGSAIPFSNNTPTNDSCVNWNQYYSVCKASVHNPFHGAITFDNIGLAWVAIFQVISLEGWVDIMYYVQDTHSFWDWIYFVLLIVIGAFFMINLCLVVIATQFSETKKRETERMLQERKRFHSSSTLASNNEPGGCYDEIIKYLAHLGRRGKRKILKWFKHARGRRQRKVNPERAISLKPKRKRKRPKGPPSNHQPAYHPNYGHPESPEAPRASPEVSDVDPVSSPRRPGHLLVPSDISGNPSADSLQTITYTADGLAPHDPNILRTSTSSPNRLTPGIVRTPSIGGSSHTVENVPDVVATHGLNPHGGGALSASSGNSLMSTDPNMLHPDIRGPAAKRNSAPHLTTTYTEVDPQRRPSHVTSTEYEMSDFSSDRSSSDDSDEEDRPRKKQKNCIDKCRHYVKRFVDSKHFQRGILAAILVNTLSMGIEYHNQPYTLTQVLEYSNLFFSALFATEMGLKIIAEGVFGYIKNGFNVFDGFIVILSLVELVQGAGGGLSVLRTFRLLRILKLVRFLPALRYQLVVMLRTMDNVATFFALLVLFIFIFSILGMNLFGCKFCERDPNNPKRQNCGQAGRKNFDSLLWALITVFQILTQEDWNEVLYNGMSKTSPWASLYFIALMTFGNYVLFNLLVAILVEGFSSEGEEKRKAEEERELEEEEEKLKKIKDINKLEDKEHLVRMCKCKLAPEEPQKEDNPTTEDIKNNKEKEKILLGLPPSVSVTKEENHQNPPIYHGEQVAVSGPLNPPIITHTAATPMATPQGSPNEASNNNKDIKNNLAVARAFHMSSLSIDSIDKSSSMLSIRSSTPRPSPVLSRRNSRKSQNWLNILRGKEDNRSLVDSQSESGEEGEEDNNRRPQMGRRSSINNFSPSNAQQAKYMVLQLTNVTTADQLKYSLIYTASSRPATPISPSHSDCNGHAPLNNQRTLSPQNSFKSYHTLTPRNSIKGPSGSISRHNSLTSQNIRLSPQNSFRLSRQNSINSQNTLSPQNSLGSTPGEVQNNLRKSSSDNGERQAEGEEQEADCTCSWCPEPKGCFLERRDWALYLFPPDHRVRLVCQTIISKKWFDYTVLFFIAVNCITLAMERPDIPADSIERQFLTFANYVFTVVFAFEMAVKVLAKGFACGRQAYIKSGWNVMDGFLVIISLIDVTISLSASSSPRIFGILRVFRLLRTLRPLRVISRAPGLKLVVQTLLSSLRPIGNIVLICCTFFIIFGILGVQLFKGTFYHCEGPDVDDVHNKTDCYNKGPPYRWVNTKYNFDNLGQALMALFVLASKDGWVNIMYTGLDAVGVDQQPIENYNEWRLFYFISFLLLVGFFVLNMFVGVVVENFHKCRENQEKEERARRAAKRAKKLEKKRRSMLNPELEPDEPDEARELYLARKAEMREPPYWSHYSKPRLFIHTIISSKYFDLAIAGVIGLNVITMALEYYMMPQELEYALKIFNFFFTSVFILEAVVKVVALGGMRYMRDRWNQLDMGIVILSIVGIILEEMKSGFIPINPTIIRVMRVLRIARVLKLLKMAKGIRALLDTVMQALPQVGNLGLLFFLLFFIFAALGVELFGRLECSHTHPCEGLSKHAHFQNFGMAFLTLFRVATGDNWNGIMKDTLREDCDASDDCTRNCCVSPIIAPVFFVVFVLMAQFVLVNVVVAVLMKHLEDGKENFEDDDDLDDSDRDFWDELIDEGLIPRPPALRAAPSLSAADADVHVTVVSSTSSPQPCSDSLLCQEPAEPHRDTTTGTRRYTVLRVPDPTSPSPAAMESHKQMDDDAELEAEIQRELENEEARNNEQLLANMREREKAEEAALAKLQGGFTSSSFTTLSDSDDPYIWDSLSDLISPARRYYYEEANDDLEECHSFLNDEADDDCVDDDLSHKMICKQSSLPPDFTFNVRPPSTEDVNRNTDDRTPDSRLTPTAIEVTVPSDTEQEDYEDDPMIRSPTDSDLNQNCFSPSLSPPIQSPTLQSPTLQSPTLSFGSEFAEAGLEGRNQPPQSLTFIPACRSPLSRQNAVPSSSSSPRTSPGPQIPEEGMLSSLPASPYPPEWTQPGCNNQPFRKSDPSVYETEASGGFSPHTLDPQHMYLRHRSQPSVNRSRSMGSGDPSPTLSKYHKSHSQPHTYVPSSPIHPDDININMFDPYPRQSPSNSSMTDYPTQTNNISSPNLGEEENRGVFHPLRDGPPPSYEEATEEEPLGLENLDCTSIPGLDPDIPQADDVDEESEREESDDCDEEVRQINALSPEESSTDSSSDTTSINAILSGLEDSLVVGEGVASPDSAAASSCPGGCAMEESLADLPPDLPSPPHYGDLGRDRDGAEGRSPTDSTPSPHNTDSNINTVGCEPSACSQSEYGAIAQNFNKSDASHSEPAGSSKHMQINSPPPSGSPTEATGPGDYTKRTRSCVVDETQEPVKRRKSQNYRPKHLALPSSSKDASVSSSGASVIVNETEHDGEDQDVDMTDSSPKCSSNGSEASLPDVVLSGTTGPDGGYV